MPSASAIRVTATIPPLHREPPPAFGLEEGGRGLRLVDTLAARWGYCRDADSAVTWFELSEAAPQQ